MKEEIQAALDAIEKYEQEIAAETTPKAVAMATLQQNKLVAKKLSAGLTVTQVYEVLLQSLNG